MTARFVLQDSKLISNLSGRGVSARDRFAANQLLALIKSAEFPCVGAKAAAAQNGVMFSVHDSLNVDFCAPEIVKNLQAFKQYSSEGNFEAEFTTFAAIFDATEALSEDQFHKWVWQLLSAVKLQDPDPLAAPSNVSQNVEDSNFAFCLSGEPYFVVGLHPTASRYARRFAFPTLVFNLHSQFEKLRASGRFDKMQRVIRERDTGLQGGTNPNLSDFGEASEACQYSGKAKVAPSDCPYFNRKGMEHV